MSTVDVTAQWTFRVPRCAATLGDDLRCTLGDGHAFGHVYESAAGDIGDEQPGDESW